MRKTRVARIPIVPDVEVALNPTAFAMADPQGRVYNYNVILMALLLNITPQAVVEKYPTVKRYGPIFRRDLRRGNYILCYCNLCKTVWAGTKNLRIHKQTAHSAPYP